MNPHELLSELESIEGILAFADALRPRQVALMEVLDALTQPAPQAVPRSPVLPRRGCGYRSEFLQATTKIELYIAVLKRIWREFPELREKIADRLKRESYSRSYVAVTPTALFDVWPEWKARRHSVVLVDGWYADRNVGQKQMARVLRIAAEVAGLRWGADIRVEWA